MGLSYTNLLPSTHIYNGLEIINAAVARATIRSYQQAPTDGFKRVIHAADLHAKLGFISGASSGRGCFTQVALVGLLSLGAAPLAAYVPAALADASYLLTEPFFACLTVGEAVVFVGVGPRSSACARAAGRAPSEDESLFQYGFLGILEQSALENAQSSARAGNAWTSHAAHACAFGIAIALEPIRAPLACLLVTVRLVSACLHAVCYAVLGVIVATAARGPTTQSTMADTDAMQAATELLGVAEPACVARRAARVATVMNAPAAAAAFELYSRELEESIRTQPLGSPPSYNPPAYEQANGAVPLEVSDTSLFTTNDHLQPPPPYQREFSRRLG